MGFKILKFQIVAIITGFVLALTTLASCTVNSGGYYFPVLGFNEPRILIANSTVTPAAHTITMYDINGHFLSILYDTSAQTILLRGIAILDAFRIVISTDTPDQLHELNIATGENSVYAQNSLLTGTIYQVVSPATNIFLVAETSTIEKFDGPDRVPVAGNPYINTTLGACTISTARGMTLNSSGDLIVVSNVNNSLLRYDISTETAACTEANAGFGANAPIPVAVHPNGNLYFGTQTDDSIYEITESFTAASASTAIITGTTYTNNPTAIAVLPNGNLLVASDGNDNIVEIQTDGTIVNSSFINNAFSNAVSDIKILPAQ